MMKLIKKKVDFNMSTDEFNYLLKFINDKEKNKILKYLKFEDAVRSLIGKIILVEELGLHKLELEYNKYGKPRLINQDNIHFNISHSGEWVAVVIDSNPIGVDIERVRNADLEIAKSFFHPNEKQYIFSLNKEMQREAFYKIWTLKESYIKARGMGLSMPLKSFCVDISKDIPITTRYDDEIYQFSITKVYDYYLAVCQTINVGSELIT